MPIEPDGVAHTLDVVLGNAGRGVDPPDGRLKIRWHDDTDWRDDVLVELAFGSEGEDFPDVARLLFRIEAVDHDLRLRRIVELVLEAVVARNAVALGDVERALVEGDSVR